MQMNTHGRQQKRKKEEEKKKEREKNMVDNLCAIHDLNLTIL
jgi:hypothetical protein